MKFFNKFKSYKFWVALTSAIIIFLKTLGNEIGLHISQEVLSNIVMSFCAILVVLGFVKDDRDGPKDQDN